MPDKIIVIDGPIGRFSYSKEFIRAMLDGSKGKDVLVKISSLGGDPDHALDIKNQFTEHGNITAELSGFVASSATVIALGAKKTKMADNALYIVHKVAGMIDVFGYFNDDDIEGLIQKLEKEKNEAAKVSLILAREYSKKTGKPTSEMLDLMKEETWLTAEEAKDFGFIDEIYTPGEKVNYLNDYKMVAMIEASGLPKPKRASTLNKNKEMSTETFVKDENSFIAWLKEKFGLMPKAADPIPDPKESEEITNLKNEIENLKTQVNTLKAPEPKKEDDKKDESEIVNQLKNDLAELKAQIQNISKAPALDKDPAKDTDKSEPAPKNEFSEKVAEAHKMFELHKEYFN
jgi:ATP-dependent protease ClpP protease subunit